MREILFRGKKESTGDWVFGDLRHYRSGKVGIHSDVLRYTLLVDSETVGQYTGLRDCKRTAEYPEGQMIFEGDIVEVTDDEGMTNRCDCGIGEVYFLDGLWYIGQQVSNSLYDINKCFYIEVIGNIHDNEEVLEEGEE